MTLKLWEFDMLGYDQLIVYALLAVPKIQRFSVPTRFLMKGLCCTFFYTICIPYRG